MGLSSIWTALVGPRVKEITPHRPFSFEQQLEASLNANPTNLYGNHAAAFSEVLLSQPARAPEDKKAKRRSRAFSLSNTKSEGDLKKRKSWFGGKLAAENAPVVPALPMLQSPGSGLGWNAQDAIPEPEPTRPGTALTTDDPISWSRPVTPELAEVERMKSRRLSLGRALMSSRKRSKSTVTQSQPPKLEKRYSVLGGHREMAPPVPTNPAFSTELINPNSGVASSLGESLDKRKSRRMSLSRAFGRQRSKSTSSNRSQRSSWWQSSNPDDDEAPPLVSAVLSLTWDDGTATPDSSIAFTSSPDNTDVIGHAVFADSPMRTVTRGTSIKHPRPVSGVSLSSRKSYKPKNAASGSIRSTRERSSRRHSLLDDGDGGMICLSEEQQWEWDKLKHLMVTLEQREDSKSPIAQSVASVAEDNGVLGMLRELEDDEDRRHRRMYSNAEALAALEFGTAK